MDVLILDCGTDIAGECLLSDYTGKIELLSFSHGVAQQITGDQSNTKRTSGKPNHQDFTVTKYVDLASCKLIDFCNQAKPLASITVTVGQNDNGTVVKYFTYVMTNALISSVSVGGGGGGKPQETVTFNYTKMTWTYNQQKEEVGTSGNNSAIWDLSTNKNS
ncbi:MAG: type VI secretion system tube protein Hcp [Proteobacteria bacterium]|nr:MAG: type VI secretion system tube protein Hcp [Pseudomonadota bacterium]